MSCAECEYVKTPIIQEPCASCMEYGPINFKQKHEVIGRLTNMKYVDYVYDFVKKDCEGMDSVYADYIITLVGEHGLNALKEHNLVEGCGILNGRKLYVLCDK